MKICAHPGCGHIFPVGQQVSDICPNGMDHSPLEEGAVYSIEEWKNREIISSSYKFRQFLVKAFSPTIQALS